VDQAWSSAGAALEPSAEPLALLTAQTGDQEARHRRAQQPGYGSQGSPREPGYGAQGSPREPGYGAQGSPREPGYGAQGSPQQPRYGSQASYSPGPDDDTPAGGLPVVEPPLWREAARYSGVPTTYEPPYPQYAPPQTEPVADTGGPAPGPPEPPQLPTVPEPPGPPQPEAAEQTGLPQRVPAEPDVPVSRDQEAGDASPSDQPGSRDRWTAPELAWIADQLRRDDVPSERPPETFDVDAVVAAVGEVPGVRSASVRTNPTGVHTLRLDLADDADPGQVSRTVARLLLERMGLSAAPQHVPQARTSQETAAPERSSPAGEVAGGLAPSGAPAPPEPLAPREPLPPPEPVGPPEQLIPPEPRPLEPRPLERRPLEPLPSVPAPSPVPSAPPARWTLPVPRPAEGGWRPADDDYAPEAYEASEQLTDDPLQPPPEDEPEPVSRPLLTGQSAPRVVINQVQVSTYGLEATVEVQLTAGDRRATGMASGPAVDSYLVRLAAVAAAKAIDELLRAVVEPGGPSRCFVEHTGVVSFGNTDVAVAVVLLVCGGWVEQLTGSALVDADPRQAVVRATLGAVNRRLEALLD
jgi:hypothetical protein